MENRISEFQNLVDHILPLVEANLSAAHSEYLEGDIPRGAFEHINSRFGTAKILASHESIENLTPAMAAFAPLFIDLRSGLKDCKGDEEKKFHRAIDNLKSFYADNGFNKSHSIFEFPISDNPIDSNLAIFRDDTFDVFKSFQGMSSGNMITLVEPKDNSPSYIDNEKAYPGITVENVKKAIDKDLLEVDSYSNDPQLSAIYTTYRFSEKALKLANKKLKSSDETEK